MNPLKKSRLNSNMSKSTHNFDFPKIPLRNKKDITITRELKEKPFIQKKGIYQSMLPSKKHLLKNKSTLFSPIHSGLYSSFHENNEEAKEKRKSKGKEFYNKLSLERINFQFEEYGEYPCDDFQPSIYFFKFLCNKPDYEKENSEKGKPCSSRLKLFIPDTIILNDLDTNSSE